MRLVYAWGMTWAVVAALALLATIQQEWDAALMLALLQWAPAIWTGQAWDRYQDPEQRWHQ